MNGSDQDRLAAVERDVKLLTTRLAEFERVQNHLTNRLTQAIAATDRAIALLELLRDQMP